MRYKIINFRLIIALQKSKFIFIANRPSTHLQGLWLICCSEKLVLSASCRHLHLRHLYMGVSSTHFELLFAPRLLISIHYRSGFGFLACFLLFGEVSSSRSMKFSFSGFGILQKIFLAGLSCFHLQFFSLWSNPASSAPASFFRSKKALRIRAHLVK